MKYIDTTNLDGSILSMVIPRMGGCVDINNRVIVKKVGEVWRLVGLLDDTSDVLIAAVGLTPKDVTESFLFSDSAYNTKSYHLPGFADVEIFLSFVINMIGKILEVCPTAEFSFVQQKNGKKLLFSVNK
jgi:hypothetical protein